MSLDGPGWPPAPSKAAPVEADASPPMYRCRCYSALSGQAEIGRLGRRPITQSVELDRAGGAADGPGLDGARLIAALGVGLARVEEVSASDGWVWRFFTFSEFPASLVMAFLCASRRNASTDVIPATTECLLLGSYEL